MTGEPRKRTLGLAAILIVGTVAGFLAAAGTGGAAYATVGTVAESQAFQMPVEEEDQRVRFALAADQATATQPAASFALYDPGDEFFTEFQLSGEGDDAEAILDWPGSWVLFVTEQRNAELQVQYEAQDEGDDVKLTDLPVKEERTVVAEQDEGALDEEVVFRLDQRPASAFLTFEGNVSGLDATVNTQDGPVYELTDASANASEEGSRTGEVDVTSANLAAGTYEVTAEADSFDGELAFVHQTYERIQEPEKTQPETPEEPNATTYTEEHEGEVVAELSQHEAYEIDTAEASAIAFLTSQDTEAELSIYNASDRLVEQVEIGDDHSYDWDDHEENESENASRERGNASLTTVELPAAGSFVVYAEAVYPHEEAVRVFVADEQAQGEQLEVAEEEVTLEGNQASWNTTLDGALVEISAHTMDAASTERNVTVTGEAGTVLHYEQSVNTFGAAIYEDSEVHPERFTSGDIEATMDADGFGGETRLELVHYVR